MLLDALVAAAAARGVPNLQADILASNVRMLALVADRGYLTLERRGSRVRVAIDAAGGRSGEWLQPTRIGDPDAPLTDKQLDDKYLELAGPVLGEAPARELLARLWALEAAPGLGA